MATSTFSVRMDDKLKSQFEDLCDSFGMNMTTAINVFARAVVREKKIPFEISANMPEVSREGALAALASIRTKAIQDGIADMPLADINAEISKTRRG